MPRIPVGQTILYSVSFLFARFGAVLRICWLPALLIATIDYTVAITSANRTAQYEATGDTGVLAVNAAVSIAATLVGLFLSSIAATGVAREALGMGGADTRGPLPIGRMELRMFGAYVSYVLAVGILVVLALVVTAIAFVAAGVPLNVGPEAQELTLAAFLAAMIGLAAFTYVFVSVVRIGFFLPATVVAEKNTGLKRSYDLTQGNFLRVLAVVFVLALPLLALTMASDYLLLGEDYGLAGESAGEALTPVQDASGSLLWQALSMAIFVVVTGLMVSASAFAYRAIVQETPETNSNA